MTERILSLFATLCFVAAPALGEGQREIPPTKTWDLLVPGDKEPEKLPLTGKLRDNWDRPEDVKNGYLTNKDQLADLWKALGQTDAVPEVDFAKETVVLIQLRATRIRIAIEDDRTILAFAISPNKIGVKDRKYTLATFPKEAVEAVVKANKK